MKTLLLASVAILSLGAAAPGFAQSNQDAGAAVGGATGGAAGAGVGFLLGGPIGAVIGGFAGAVIGSEAGVEAATVEYAAANPVEPIYVEGDLAAGLVLPANVTVHTIESDPAYGYIYANDRVWIVDNATRALVYSPGYVISQSTADFAVSNPVGSVTLDGDVVVGTVVPSGISLTAVPDNPNFSYVYVDDRPVLVENSSRTIVWVN